ncbi:MAG: hypothetical protein ACFCVC_05995 [Acidimicrobiia bacterium]
MRPAVATVLTALPWERELVTSARLGGMVRILGRCRSAFDVDQTLERIDAVVVGAETGWLSSALLRRWRSRGVTVVGMLAPGDRPAAEMMNAGEVDAVFAHDEPPMRVLSAIVSGIATPRPKTATGALATVVGPRGAPGRSEVALALAWATAVRRRTLLVELDDDAPGLGLRLGLVPGPGLDRSDPALAAAPRYRRHDPIELLTLPLGAGPLSRALTSRVIEAAREEFGALVVDGGPVLPEALGHDPGTPVLVLEPTPTGLVRAARMVTAWQGPEPLVVVNRVGRDEEGAVRLVRAAIGLEPTAVVAELARPEQGQPPPATMVEALRAVSRRIQACAALAESRSAQVASL